MELQPLAAKMEGIRAPSSLVLRGEESRRLQRMVWGGTGGQVRRRAMEVKMRDRSKNRKPLQKGRNLSIEAIQTVQALKRAKSPPSSSPPSSPAVLDLVMDSKFRRLLKFDMIAVLRELLRQNETSLALRVFEDIQKENWYKPQLRLYAEMIAVMVANDLIDKVEFIYFNLKGEKGLDADIEGFNSLLVTFLNHKLSDLAIDCYGFMKSVGCEPDRSSFRILVKGFESNGEMGFSAIVRQDARSYYGDSLEFLEADEEISIKQ